MTEENITFEQQVNDLTAKLVDNGKGVYELPSDISEGMSQELKYAVTLEKRRRDTQASLSRVEQEANKIKKLNEKLSQEWQKSVTLSPIQVEELEELKRDDPEAWRLKINEMEENNRKAVVSREDEISKEVYKETELEQRIRMLEEYNAANPTFNIDNDVIENEIPPKYTKKLERGEVTFDEFLLQCKTYLSKGKVVGGSVDLADSVSLSKASGGGTPSQAAVSSAARDSYSRETF